LVSFFSSENISCSRCLTRTNRSGVTHYYHGAITPVYVQPGQSQVLSLAPEFMVTQDVKEKQE